MYASDTRNSDRAGELRHSYALAVKIYIAVTVFTAVFGAVYEHFSFGVYSIYMQYAFLVPFLLGAVPSFILACRKNPPRIRIAARRLWHDGIAVLTVGSLFTGVLHIYGTASGWSAFYAFVGALLLVLALLLHKEVCPGEVHSR
ncbi:MAG: hypothetical protein J5643_05945 [Lachnospiraceae bacterium]|nr:hypothetical protein [Lachnospiraceae bacterium]